ncbi:Methyl-CpG-binding domain-containing protein [Arachis hypogaea]|nr:Methyl-CpG-binding domain-containing protein [Arachis hypogaea]
MIMELTDSGSAGDRTTAPQPQDSRSSGLEIDLNEIPYAAASPSSNHAETLPPPPDSAVDIVRAYHENPAPLPGAPASLPRGSAPCATCSKPPGAAGVVVCDGCERVFHIACAGFRGTRQAAILDEWLCSECAVGGVRSKRWPLGVKSKQLLDINASPPSDADGEGAGEELQDSRKHTPGDNSFGANPFGAPVTCSNYYNGNTFGFQKASGVVTHAVRVGFEDILNHTQSMTRCFEEALRDFISERRGVLEEGWRVEFRQSMNSSELYAVYCAPDGKIFDSVYEVACYLGLTSGYNSMESEVRNDRSLASLGGTHLSRKRKSTRNLSNGFVEKLGTLINSYCRDSPSDALTVECTGDHGHVHKASEIARKEDCHSGCLQSSDRLPLRFGDFFVLSLGKVDDRPTYYDVHLICPIGYKSCWHDKITGSLFTCEVLEGGDSGPIFRIKRCSCSEFPVPVGSTVLSMSNLCQFLNKNNGERKTDDSMDYDVHESIQMILSDPCVPTENDVINCIASFSNETCAGDSISQDSGLIDGIGEILVEERSSSAAWRVISQKVVNACNDICKQKGSLKFYCKHIEDEPCLHKWDTTRKKSDAHFSLLDKFCGSLCSVSVPDVTYADNDLKGLSEVLGKWLEQDRFGLDVEFVQEVLEQLPGVKESLKYELLSSRSNSSSLPTVENGFLVVEWRGGSQYQDENEAVQGSYKKPRKVGLTEKSVREDRCPPPGKSLCSRVPSELIGDILQVWELLDRFDEILDLKEPLSLDELEKELINPWFDELDLNEKSERDIDAGQVLSSQGTDDDCRPTLSSSCDAGPSRYKESSHAFIQMETEAMKEAAQVKFASFTYARCFGVALTKAHNSLLRVLVGELQSKVAALVDPNFEPGEPKTRRGRRKDIDSAIPAKRTKLNMLPINELTWPELARRYILAVLSMDGNLDSAEITARESGKVFRCLRGDGGLLCGSLSGVAGMEADALLLAEATKKIFGSLSKENDVLTMEDDESDANDPSEKKLGSDGILPEWAQKLEPVRKLPTNVGTRIRKCVYDALEMNPPEWAREILERSISKEVYKGNASGPTKKAVLQLLSDLFRGGVQQNPNKGRKKKIVLSISDIIMKQCRIVLRRAAAADDSKVFCNLLGRKLINSSDNDDEGLLGSPAMVSRPLDFRTIDLRLAAGAYGGSHEAFLEDVHELWNNVRVAFGDQPDLVELAEKLSQNFKSLYDEEVGSLCVCGYINIYVIVLSLLKHLNHFWVQVVTYFEKFVEYSKVGCLNAEMRKEVEDFIASTSEIPKAPWDEGVCKVCGIDRDDDSVLLCDTCDAEYHTYCLNPPLARIPEGNWYCPSCVNGKHATQDVTNHAQIIGKRRSKKFQGEVHSLYLDVLTHLSAVMEEKEYWEYSVGERTSLLKFLCDELLNSSLIRQHLEQCADLSAELHQKLRSLSTEWKNLKTKEDILSSKAAKVVTCMPNTTGEVGFKEGVTAALSSTGKCLVQPHNVIDNPNNFGVSVDSLQSEEVTNEKHRLNGVDKSVSVINSDSENKHLNSIDVEGQLRNVSAAVASQCMDKSTKSFPSPSHMPHEQNGTSGAAHIQGNHQKCDVNDISTVDESEPYRLEINAIKSDISRLEDSIADVGSKLLKLSIRREFLGIDSIGRLYYASAVGRGRLVVDASAAVLYGRQMAVGRDSVDKFSSLQHNVLSDKDNYKIIGLQKDSSCLMSPPSDGSGISSSWVAYETDAEIEELLSWLKDNDPKEKELKDSIMMWPKSRAQEFLNSPNEGQVEEQGNFPIPRNKEKTASNSLVTKATSLLEKNYGPFFEWDGTEVSKKRSKNARVNNDEKLYRCECLEPIWPSRKHCMSCHKTVSSDVELVEHIDGKCNAGLPALEKNRDDNLSSKGRGNTKCDSSREIFRGDADTAGTAAATNVSSKLSSRLIKFSNEESSCPFNFEDICSKFVTNDSCKEVVREIGLIGSNGIPSFLPSISPFVSDSTLMLFSAQNNDRTGGGESLTSECQVSLGSTDGAGKCHDKKSGMSLASNEISKAGISNKISLEQKDGNLSEGNPALDIGVDSCCVVPLSSLRPLVGRSSHILRQLKISLLDMDAALPKVALRPSKAQSDRRQAWRAFVKSAETIYQMVQATISLEDMIKTEYLRNDWWYWSSFSAAVKSSTLPSLALRIYSLDSAIIYEKMPNSSGDSSEPSATEQKPPANADADKLKASRKSSRKRKEPDG